MSDRWIVRFGVCSVLVTLCVFCEMDLDEGLLERRVAREMLDWNVKMIPYL